MAGRSMLRLALVIVCAFVPLGASASEPSELTGVASVIDGDTIEIHGTRIRLHGIDAPESAQLCIDANDNPWRCGQQASLALAERIGRAPVSCRRTDTDHYGRMIAVCSSGTENLNAWLVAEGWAVAYRRYSGDYVAREDEAREARRNIWSGRFVMPWDWRRGAQIVAEDPATERSQRCAIKGNINRDGKRIYHVPAGRFYEPTRIDTSKGERWFCSEAEARAAGWRRSRQ